MEKLIKIDIEHYNQDWKFREIVVLMNSFVDVINELFIKKPSFDCHFINKHYVCIHDQMGDGNGNFFPCGLDKTCLKYSNKPPKTDYSLTDLEKGDLEKTKANTKYTKERIRELKLKNDEREKDLDCSRSDNDSRPLTTLETEYFEKRWKKINDDAWNTFEQRLSEVLIKEDKSSCTCGGYHLTNGVETSEKCVCGETPVTNNQTIGKLVNYLESTVGHLKGNYWQKEAVVIEELIKDVKQGFGIPKKPEKFLHVMYCTHTNCKSKVTSTISKEAVIDLGIKNGWDIPKPKVKGEKVDVCCPEHNTKRARKCSSCNHIFAPGEPAYSINDKLHCLECYHAKKHL